MAPPPRSHSISCDHKGVAHTEAYALTGTIELCVRRTYLAASRRTAVSP